MGGFVVAVATCFLGVGFAVAMFWAITKRVSVQ